MIGTIHVDTEPEMEGSNKTSNMKCSSMTNIQSSKWSVPRSCSIKIRLILFVTMTTIKHRVVDTIRFPWLRLFDGGNAKRIHRLLISFWLL